MIPWILLLWPIGDLYPAPHHYARYDAHITTQQMESRASCIYALQEIKKAIPSIDGYCVPK